MHFSPQISERSTCTQLHQFDLDSGGQRYLEMTKQLLAYAKTMCWWNSSGLGGRSAHPPDLMLILETDVDRGKYLGQCRMDALHVKRSGPQTLVGQHVRPVIAKRRRNSIEKCFKAFAP